MPSGLDTIKARGLIALCKRMTNGEGFPNLTAQQVATETGRTLAQSQAWLTDMVALRLMRQVGGEYEMTLDQVARANTLINEFLFERLTAAGIP